MFGLPSSLPACEWDFIAHQIEPGPDAWRTTPPMLMSNNIISVWLAMQYNQYYILRPVSEAICYVICCLPTPPHQILNWTCCDETFPCRPRLPTCVREGGGGKPNNNRQRVKSNTEDIVLKWKTWALKRPFPVAEILIKCNMLCCHVFPWSVQRLSAFVLLLWCQSSCWKNVTFHTMYCTSSAVFSLPFLCWRGS